MRSTSATPRLGGRSRAGGVSVASSNQRHRRTTFNGEARAWITASRTCARFACGAMSTSTSRWRNQRRRAGSSRTGRRLKGPPSAAVGQRGTTDDLAPAAREVGRLACKGRAERTRPVHVELRAEHALEVQGREGDEGNMHVLVPSERGLNTPTPLRKCSECNRNTTDISGMCLRCETRETVFHRLGARIAMHPDGTRTLQWEAPRRGKK